MSIIIKVHARQILDSRGNPTIEVDVGPGGDFNESIQLTVIENMYNKGDLTKYEYVKYAPNNLMPGIS